MINYQLFYRLIQNLIFGLLGKKNFFSSISILIKELHIDHIIDIGGGDGVLLNYLKDCDFKSYTCFEPDETLIAIAKKKFNGEKIKFINKSVDYITLDDLSKENSIVLMLGVVHHIDNEMVKKIVSKLNKNKVITYDPFFHKDINPISFLLKKMDKGKYIRNLKSYSEILKGFNFTERINVYFRFYSSVIYFKNIDKEIIEKYL